MMIPISLRSTLILSSYLGLGLPEGLFPVGLLLLLLLLLYCIERGDHCCPMHCDLFKIYRAPPNLGINQSPWLYEVNDRNYKVPHCEVFLFFFNGMLNFLEYSKRLI